MARCMHQKSGKEYILLGNVSIKIPIIRAWVNLVKYQSIENGDIYYRFKSDFDKKFMVNFNLNQNDCREHDWVDGEYNGGSSFGYCAVKCKKCGIESLKLFGG